jgi:hypothetical protein
MLAEPEMQGALDQPAELEPFEDVQQRAVLVLVPAERVAKLGLTRRSITSLRREWLSTSVRGLRSSAFVFSVSL